MVDPEPGNKEPPRLQMTVCTQIPPLYILSSLNLRRNVKADFGMYKLLRQTICNTLNVRWYPNRQGEELKFCYHVLCVVHFWLETRVFPVCGACCPVEKASDMGMKTAQAAARERHTPLPTLTYRFSYLNFAAVALPTWISKIKPPQCCD